MRIISGKHKGRVLKQFKGDDIRPTADRAKEALFNILSYKVNNATVLDLFSGTGNIGLEALSRGAIDVTMVDASKESVALIKSNLQTLKENATVEFLKAETYLLKTTKTFDIIFLDPPYDYVQADDLFKVVFERNLLNDDGIIVYEHKSDYIFDSKYFESYDVRKYGIATFNFLRRKV